MSSRAQVSKRTNRAITQDIIAIETEILKFDQKELIDLKSLKLLTIPVLERYQFYLYHYIITHNYSTELKNHLNKIFGIFENTDIEPKEDQQDQLEKKQRIKRTFFSLRTPFSQVLSTTGTIWKKYGTTLCSASFVSPLRSTLLC